MRCLKHATHFMRFGCVNSPRIRKLKAKKGLVLREAVSQERLDISKGQCNSKMARESNGWLVNGPGL